MRLKRMKQNHIARRNFGQYFIYTDRSLEKLYTRIPVSLLGSNTPAFQTNHTTTNNQSTYQKLNQSSEREKNPLYTLHPSTGNLKEKGKKEITAHPPNTAQG